MVSRTVKNEDGTTSFTMGVAVDEEHVQKVDLSKPVVFVERRYDDGAKGHMLIDGWHRVAKALDNEVDELPCVVLSVKEGRACEI